MLEVGNFTLIKGQFALQQSEGSLVIQQDESVDSIIIIIIILTNILLKLLSLFFFLAKLTVTSDCVFLLLSDFLPHLGAQ